MKCVKLKNENVCPSKIVCIGKNYTEHIKELNDEIPKQQVIFIKPNSSISNDIYSNKNDVIHYEGEISFLIKSGEINGVGFGLDLTKREIQSKLKAKGLPWERSKAFNKAAVFSEFIPFNGNINDLRLELYINDRLAQSGGCDLMINKPAQILNEIKSFISLEDNDIIMSGTPKGVGPIKSGDKFHGKIFEGEKLIVESIWTAK